jgi:hypothetical protein
MQSENKTRMTSLFNLEVLASLLMVVGMQTCFRSRISGYCGRLDDL